MSFADAPRAPLGPAPGPPRGVLRRYAPPPDRLTHARHAPCAALADVVEHYWIVAWDLRGLPPFDAETLPHPSVHVVAEAGAALVYGVARGKFTTTLHGVGRTIGVKFRPGAFHAFLRRPVSTLAGRRVPTVEAFREHAPALDRLLLADAPVPAVLARLDDFLCAHRPPPDDEGRAVGEIVAEIMRDRTLTRAEDVAARHGTSLRTLQRRFGRHVGATPKWVIQRYRLHEAAERLAADPRVEHSALALELGYGDQAHFVNDFRRVIGVAPAAYAREARRGRADA